MVAFSFEKKSFLNKVLYESYFFKKQPPEMFFKKDVLKNLQENTCARVFPRNCQDFEIAKSFHEIIEDILRFIEAK